MAGEQEFTVHVVADSESGLVQVYSEGMEKHGRLNLYLADVPTVLWRSGGDFVSNVCQATLKGDAFDEGTTHTHPDYGRWQMTRVDVALGQHGMEQETMLQIVPLPITCLCDKCKEDRERKRRGSG